MKRALPVLFLLLPVLARSQEPAASPSPAAAPAAAEPRVVGRDVPPPKRVKSVSPSYPAAAQAIGQRGIVIVQLVVGPDGKVASAEIVRSVPPFDDAALAAVRQWEYEPTKVDGQPVSVSMTIPITFAMRLPDVAREAGVPEMRQGVPPPFPGGAPPKQPAQVKAELTIDPQGQVKEASVVAGNPPYTEAVMQALRTWAFVPPSDGSAVTVSLEATFSEGKEGARVQMRLFGARAATLAAAATPAAPPTAAPSAAPIPAPAPAASRPTAAVVAIPAPASELPAPRPPVAVSTPAPRGTAAAGARTTPPVRAAAPAGASTPAAPPVEIVPAPPTPKPTDSSRQEAGVSAVRDVTLTEGVPDLTSGRRPQVPPLARMDGLTGKVEVRFVVEASGATSNLELAGPEALREAARQTVGSWTFRRGSTERLFLVTTIDYGPEAARAQVKRQG